MAWWDDWDDARDGPKMKQKLTVPQGFIWTCCDRAGKPVDGNVLDRCQRGAHEAVEKNLLRV